MTLLQNMQQQQISKDAINALPLGIYSGKIKLIQTKAELHTALDNIYTETVIGFDTESRPNFVKGENNAPALIQIGCANIVYLIQLRHIPLGQELISLLENKSIIKTGVAIRDDMRILRQLQPFEPHNILDLGEAARNLQLGAQGLRSMAAFFMGIRISKGARCSNWDMQELSRQQVNYAATDAWASREIYLHMQNAHLLNEALVTRLTKELREDVLSLPALEISSKNKAYRAPRKHKPQQRKTRLHKTAKTTAK